MRPRRASPTSCAASSSSPSTRASSGGFEASRNARCANDVPGLREVGPEEIREIEPHAAGIRRSALAIHRASSTSAGSRSRTPTTSRRWAPRSAPSVAGQRHRGAPGEMVLTVSGRRRRGARRRRANVITCAGPPVRQGRRDDRRRRQRAHRAVPGRLLHAHAGRPVPLQGPDLSRARPGFPFLGVHFTKRIDGEVWAGPNAVLAFAREGYARSDISPAQLAEHTDVPRIPAARVQIPGTGLAEMWRDFWKGAFLKDMQRYVPEVRGDQIVFGPSGVRAQSLRGDGSWSTTSRWASRSTSSTSETPRRPRRRHRSPSGANSPAARSHGSTSA